ncbi:baseplate J/gp47 family protein [Streptococcus mutans]|nr:baseplate J/gp47 family protein [Streptococcus mutans]
MLSNVGDDQDRTVGSFIWDATRAGAAEFDRQLGEIDRVEKKLNVDNLKGDELSRFVYQRTGLVRKPATYATTTVVLTGSPNVEVEKGELVSTDTVTYRTTHDVMVGDNGTVSVEVIAVEPGNKGNVPANTITQFPSYINGIVDVYNPIEVTNGFDEEDDDALRKRYYDKLQRPGKAGNVYHYREWALEVVGVGDVRVVPRWNGPLTVKVVVIDSNMKPADEELVDQVMAHVEEERPFGATVTVAPAEPLAVNIKVNVLNHVGQDTDVLRNAYLTT